MSQRRKRLEFAAWQKDISIFDLFERGICSIGIQHSHRRQLLFLVNISNRYPFKLCLQLILEIGGCDTEKCKVFIVRFDIDGRSCNCNPIENIGGSFYIFCYTGNLSCKVLQLSLIIAVDLNLDGLCRTHKVTQHVANYLSKIN